MFDQFNAYQASVVGPHLSNGPTVLSATVATGFLFVPDWTFLGAKYDAVVVLPFQMSTTGAPANIQQAGMHNTYIAPLELSWKLGDSGFFVKTGFGMYVPDGTVTGANGLGSIGNPWWTFQPEFVVSYLKDGWNLTANLFAGIQTRNTVTGYRTGDILQAEFTATKTIGSWRFGPVAYYAGQVSDDSSSAFYKNAVNLNRYGKLGVGALVGYDFGPAALTVWFTDEVWSSASGKTPLVGGLDVASVTRGYTAFGQLSYRLWAPDQTASSQQPRWRKQ